MFAAMELLSAKERQMELDDVSSSGKDLDVTLSEVLLLSLRVDQPVAVMRN